MFLLMMFFRGTCDVFYMGRTMEALVMELCKSWEILGESNGYYEENKAFLFGIFEINNDWFV